MRDYGAAESLLDAEHVVHARLIEIETHISTLRYNNSGWDLEWPADSGQIWLAGGGVLGIDLPDEDATLTAHDMVVEIASLNPDQTSLALNNNLHGRYCAVYHAVIDVSGPAYVIAGVAREYSGRISAQSVHKPALAGQQGNG